MTQPNAPVWLAPAQVGMLSNKRGANTGADSIALQARYSNGRQSADLAGMIRIIASRIANISGPVAAETAWDSGWTGTRTISALPLGGAANSYGYAASTTVQYGGRVYTVVGPNGPLGFKHSEVLSAPILAGGGLGVWRFEASFRTNVSPYSATVALGRLYILDATPSIWSAPINADGTLGTWVQDAVNVPANNGQLIGGQMSAAYSSPNQGFLICVGSTISSGSAAVTTVSHVGLNTDGTLQSWVATTALPAARRGFGYYFDNVNGFLVIAGGEDATPTVQATIYTASVPLSSGTPGAVGAWSTQTNPLPSARSRVALVVTNQDATQYIFAIGGTTTAAETGAITEVRAATLSNAVGVGQVGAWSAALAPALPAALCSLGAIVTAPSGAQEGYIITIGGRTAAPADNLTCYSIQQTGAGALTGAWASGTAAGLTAGDLGTGGVLTNNQDGSQDCTFLYGGFGTAVLIAGFTDGDQVQFDAYFTDVQNSDVSQVASTIVKIGQPPTLSAVLPGAAITTAQPTASFRVLVGVGGGPEDSWQVTVKDPQGVTVFDSGIRRDRNNSVLINPAPLLKTGVAYTFTWQVWSNDAVFNGASNTGSSTLAVTPTLATPSVPTAVAATADNANGLVNLSWLNPSPPATSGNRIYYRRSGQMAWRLLSDVLGPTTLQQLMDMLCVAVGYDFAVSQTDLAVNAFVESAHSSPLSSDMETAGTTATLWKSLGTDATGTITRWSVDAGVPVIAANVVTMPAGAQMRGGHQDWDDLTNVQAQFVFSTSSQPYLLLHAPGSSTWVRVRVDGANIHLDKSIAGVASNDVSAAVAAALVNGTTYWLQGVISGQTFTGKVRSDSANTPGAVIATIGPFAIAEAAVARGWIGLGNAGSASCTFGSAHAAVLQVSGPVPAVGASNFTTQFTTGEPAFCWSSVNPFAGTRSLSTQLLLAGDAGRWISPVPGNIVGITYEAHIQMRATAGSATNQRFSEDALVLGSNPAYDNAWHQVNGSWTATGNNGANLVYETVAGVAYFDNLTILQQGTFNVSIDSSAYGCFLHLAGAGQTYKVSPSLKGQPNFPAKLDSSITPQYGQLAPSGRYGPMNYNEIELQLFLNSYAMLQALAALMLQAQRTGGVIIYRDGFGARFTAVLDPAQGPLTYKQPAYRFANIKLIQVPDVLAPNVGQGSASSIPALVFGSIPPLDQAELLI